MWAVILKRSHLNVLAGRADGSMKDARMIDFLRKRDCKYYDLHSFRLQSLFHPGVETTVCCGPICKDAKSSDIYKHIYLSEQFMKTGIPIAYSKKEQAE